VAYEAGEKRLGCKHVGGYNAPQEQYEIRATWYMLAVTTAATDLAYSAL
jgi:hypothetical protein